MRTKVSRLAAFGAASLTLALAGCGGGGGSSPASAPVPGGPTAQNVAVSVSVIIPDAGPRASSNARRPLYVSPSTNGTSLTVKNHATQAIVFSNVENTASGSPNCTGSGASRVCTINIVVPAGSLDFALATYDTPPAGGTIPGTAKQLATSALTQTINANTSNSVTFLLSGIVSGPPGTTIAGGTPTYASVASDATTHTIGVAFSATDAAGNVITGSVPFATPIAVALTEAGGSGHATLVINGAAVGATGSLTKATDTLAIRYDGGGSSGYTTATNIGGTTVRVSPLYLTPTNTTIVNLNDSRTFTFAEASAPGSIAYTSTPTGCGSQITSAPLTGSGAAGSVTFNSTTPAGTTNSCTVVVRDILGTQMPYTVAFAVPGPIGTTGPPSFPTGGSGSCASAIAFTAVGQTASFTLSDPGYAGAFSTGNTSPATASVNLSGANVTLTALAAGTTTVSFGDTAGNSFTCAVGVTTSTGSVQ